MFIQSLGTASGNVNYDHALWRCDALRVDARPAHRATVLRLRARIPRYGRRDARPHPALRAIRRRRWRTRCGGLVVCRRPHGGFSQFTPTDGRPAEDSTRVLVWYSPTAIYFGIQAYEAHGAPHATLAKRDQIDGDDNIELLLSTLDDGRQAYVFAVNPLGIQEDGTTTEGRPPDPNNPHRANRGRIVRRSTSRRISFTSQKGRLTPYGYDRSRFASRSRPCAISPARSSAGGSMSFGRSSTLAPKIPGRQRPKPAHRSSPSPAPWRASPDWRVEWLARSQSDGVTEHAGMASRERRRGGDTPWNDHNSAAMSATVSPRI